MSTDMPMRSGYIGKPDSMRDLADRLFSLEGQKANSLYKKGGEVKSSCGKMKYAAGGAAKVRKGVCTSNGTPIRQSRQKG